MSTKRRVLVFLAIILVMFGVEKLISECTCWNWQVSQAKAQEQCDAVCTAGHGGCNYIGPMNCEGNQIQWLIFCNDGYNWFDWFPCS
jgi:hypothetical protein